MTRPGTAVLVTKEQVEGLAKLAVDGSVDVVAALLALSTAFEFLLQLTALDAGLPITGLDGARVALQVRARSIGGAFALAEEKLSDLKG